MCGFTGALAFNSSHFQITPEYIDRMRDAMIHRGPDGAGTWISGNKKVGFGHRRLSIIDRSNSASQPMLNQERNVVLSYNGEVYNYVDLKKEIATQRNFEWVTDHSDTEVILRGFELWGIEVVRKLRGEFAFSIWDDKEKCLYLVRDRIGVKPLYYSVHHGRIVFGSEIKALLCDTEQARSVDNKAFYNYLSFLTTPAPDTLFKGIHKVKPGHYLKIRENGDINEVKYWDLWEETVDLSLKSEGDIAAELLDQLRDAVRIRKMSDVPIGVFLSGGVDSSTNAALFSDNGKEQIETFSIGYDGSYQSYKDELPYARKMAESIHAKHHEYKISQEDLFSFLPQMIFLQDEPIADPVCLPVYYVAKLAKDNGVTVCQVGEGADELFWGYSSWKTSLKLQNMNDKPVPNFLKRGLLSAMGGAGKDHTLQYELLRRGVENQPIFWGGAEAFYETQKKRLIGPALRKELEGYSSWNVLEPFHTHFMKNAREKSHLNWMSYIDLNLRLPELLLMRVDKMCMGVSLEARVPYLDHKFIEFAMSIPTATKTKNDVSKYIMKKAVRGVISDEIIDRPKQGFGVPVYEWYFGKLGDKTREILRDFAKRTEFFDAKEMEIEITRNNPRNLWYMLNFALWWKHFIARESLDGIFTT